MNDKNFIGSICGNAVSACGIAISTTELSQIVSIVCTVIGTLITVFSAIIIPVWKKTSKAREDGKITPEEAEDIAKTAQDGLNKVQEVTKNEKEDSDISNKR